MTEAPYSVNFLARNPAGYELQFTVRATTEEDLAARLEQLLGRLQQTQHIPIARRESGNKPPFGDKTETPRAAVVEREAATVPDWLADEEGEPGQPAENWCPIHSVEMNRPERDGQVWFSHRAKGREGEYWCKGKLPKPSR